MRGITNAPQGGGSGGEWTQRANNNDWSDMFVFDNGIKTKKDILIYCDQTMCHVFAYIPKNTQFGNTVRITCTGSNYSTSFFELSEYLTLNYSVVAESAGSIAISTSKFALSTDGSIVTVTKSNNTTTINKSNFTVWTKD